MEYERLNIPKEGGTVFDLPLSFRKVIHEEITGLLEEGVDTGPINETGDHAGYRSMKIPMIYTFSETNAYIILYVYDMNGKELEAIAMNIVLEDLDRLLDESYNKTDKEEPNS